MPTPRACPQAILAFRGDACRHVDCSNHGLGTGKPTGSVVIIDGKLPAA